MFSSHYQLSRLWFGGFHQPCNCISKSVSQLYDLLWHNPLHLLDFSVTFHSPQSLMCTSWPSKDYRPLITTFRGFHLQQTLIIYNHTTMTHHENQFAWECFNTETTIFLKISSLSIECFSFRLLLKDLDYSHQSHNFVRSLEIRHSRPSYIL